jgi:hypothetical protein
MLDGVMLLWFLLTAASVLFVGIDIRSTPESPVLKWGFVLLTLYTGPIGAFLYVLGCREPLPGTHERYVSATWRQVLGSTMHCVAGDGVGILVGAALAAIFNLARLPEIALEYLLGFGFGWTVFQALFMRDMLGNSYTLSLRRTFLAELLSMNLLMAGMIPVHAAWRATVPVAADVTAPAFWFAISIALLVGFVAAYPMNWWLVTRGLKHGMMTMRPQTHPVPEHDSRMVGMPDSDGLSHQAHASHGVRPRLISMTALSFLALAIGLAIAMSVSAA